jgi:hypothetical protein
MPAIDMPAIVAGFLSDFSATFGALEEENKVRGKNEPSYLDIPFLKRII